MTTPRKVSGYAWRSYLSQARTANRTARHALQRILDERPGPQLTALYITEAALALGENLEALQSLQLIDEQAEGCEGAQPPYGGK
jgi:hypothetical protein